MQEFDFEQWSDLHKSDPEAFDRQRDAMLQSFIEQANPDSRRTLEQTLFTLQMHRQKAKSDLQSAVYASNLMWEAFGKMRESMNEARQVFEEAKPSLTLVTPGRMTQVDQIINRWAVSQGSAGASGTDKTQAEDGHTGAAPDNISNVIAFRPRR